MATVSDLWTACLRWAEDWRTPDRRRTILGLGALALLFALVQVVRPPDGAPSADVRQYVDMACNLARTGTFAETGDDGTAHRTARREPGWPLLLSVPIALDPALRSLQSAQVVDLFDAKANPTHVRPTSLRLPGLILLLASGLVAGLIAARAAGHGLAALPAFLLVSFNPTLSHYADGCYQEALTAPLLLATSLALMRAAQRPGPWPAALAGLAWAALSLTSARFLYLLPIPLAVLAWSAWRSTGPALRRHSAVVCFAVAVAMPVGAWMARNQQAVGEAVVSLRGGRLLAIRASYDTMDGREYLACMLHRDSSKSRPLDALGRRLLGDDAFARLARDNPDGFYFKGKFGRPRTAVATAGLSEEEAEAAIDRALEREAKAAIMAAPVKHLVVTLPLAMYGTPSVLAPLGPLNLLCFPLLLWALWWSRRPERRWLLWILLPTAGSVAFCCLLTHNISRYNAIAIPAIAVAITVGAWTLATWWTGRRPTATAT